MKHIDAYGEGLPLGLAGPISAYLIRFSALSDIGQRVELRVQRGVVRGTRVKASLKQKHQ